MDAVQDPLFAAIAAYREGNRRFCERPSPRGVEEEEAAIAATYGPPMQALVDWDKPAMSLQSAIDALQVTLDEQCFIDEIGEAMIKAVLAYLKNQLPEPTSS